MSVTTSLGVIRIQALSGISLAADECCGDAAEASWLNLPGESEYPSNSPPPAARDEVRNSRRGTLTPFMPFILLPRQCQPRDEWPCARVDRCRTDRDFRSSHRRCPHRWVSDSAPAGKQPTSSVPADSSRIAELESPSRLSAPDD